MKLDTCDDDMVGLIPPSSYLLPIWPEGQAVGRSSDGLERRILLYKAEDTSLGRIAGHVQGARTGQEQGAANELGTDIDIALFPGDQHPRIGRIDQAADIIGLIPREVGNTD